MRFIMIPGILLLIIAGWGDYADANGGIPGGGLPGTGHDFSGISVGGAVTGLCTFCHTPHQAVESLLLQNHSPSTVVFQWCGKSQTRYGTSLPTIAPVYGGSSKVCLGCHSDTIVVGDLQWFDGRSRTGPSALDSSFAKAVAKPDGCMNHPHSDHPTAFPYPFQGQVSTYNGTTNAASVPDRFEPDPTVFGIRLYREEAGGQVLVGPSTGRAGIECASCHDPHNGPQVEGNRFLRGQSSGLCQKCHRD